MRRVIVSFLLLVVALAGCTSSDPAGQPTPSPSPTPSSPSPTPTPAPPLLAPLTGLRLASASILKRPALAIKIDNHTGARPQVALDRADIVYEEPVEGGITRFIAIFHSRDAGTVGPVRSARLTDLDVLAEYGRPLLSFSGAASYVLRSIRKANLVSLPHGAYGSIYRRNSSNWVAPHNLFTSTVSLWRVARDRHTSPAPRKFTYGALLPPPPVPQPSASPGATSTPAPVIARWPSGRSVTVPFGGAWTARWRYDARLRRYVRFHASRPHRLLNGTQVNAANVLIMRVGLQKRSLAAAAHGTPELALVGSGEAVLLRNGVRIVGRWSRARLHAPTVFTDKLGRPMMFNPGVTWVELVPTKIKPRYA
ncbi:MAG: DUF3048 domain-containing protein [Actinomycetota bacterium]